MVVGRGLLPSDSVFSCVFMSDTQIAREFLSGTREAKRRMINDHRRTTNGCCRILAMKNRLAIFLLLSTTLLMTGCTLWREHPESTNWKDATGGEGLERSFWKEIKAKRWVEVEHRISSNFVGVSQEGTRFDKADALSRLQRLQLDDYTLGDLQSEMNSDTFVVTYTLAMRGTSAGQPLPSEPIRMMTVWQKQNAGWMEIAHSVQGPEKK